MFKKILVATDGSDSSRKAADYAVRLAKASGASLVAMTAETPITSPLFALDVRWEVERALEQQTHQFLSEVEKMARAAELPCQVKRVVNSVPFQAILDTAAAEGCDLIVMGSHGRSGIEALVLGSVTQKVLAHAAIPVLVSR
jgi:nucleotide-binding universal stress UspA family protein